MTQVPTELTELGFVEGSHFVGYEDDSEVPAIVAEWLRRDGPREEITKAARATVLSSFTYARRAESLADITLNEGRALMSSRTLDEPAAAGLVFEQYLQERRWAALRSQGPSLIAMARLTQCGSFGRGSPRRAGIALSRTHAQHPSMRWNRHRWDRCRGHSFTR